MWIALSKTLQCMSSVLNTATLQESDYSTQSSQSTQASLTVYPPSSPSERETARKKIKRSLGRKLEMQHWPALRDGGHRVQDWHLSFALCSPSRDWWRQSWGPPTAAPSAFPHPGSHLCPLLRDHSGPKTVQPQTQEHSQEPDTSITRQQPKESRAWQRQSPGTSTESGSSQFF